MSTQKKAKKTNKTVRKQKIWQHATLLDGKETVTYALGFVRTRSAGWRATGKMRIRAVAGLVEVLHTGVRTEAEHTALRIAISLAMANAELLRHCRPGERRYDDSVPRPVLEGYVHFRERRFQ